MLNNKSFYPTPSPLIQRMLSKIKGYPDKVLEPSAGKGDIIEGYMRRFDLHRSTDISAIEIDEDLQATLRGKGFTLIDQDFLTYSGPDKFDLIIANPPFDTGDLHLLKAIEILYRGQIVFLLNAETLKNPCTNTRKELTVKLEELGAEVEYIQNAFKDAERPTGVEVALVYIKVDRKVEDDLFAGADDTVKTEDHEFRENHEVSTRKPIEDLVAEYNQTVRIGTEAIISYYRNYRKLWKYVGLNREPDKYVREHEDLTKLMQNTLNDLLKRVRTDFWRRTLDLPQIRNRMTKKKKAEFEILLQQRCNMDFTGNNIRQFILNLIGGYEQNLTDAVLDVFDKFTIRHCFTDGVYEENIHYFNGWRTNKAFKVGKKVIVPFYGSYGAPFQSMGKWHLDYSAKDTLRDFDVVMNYFDGMSDYVTIIDAIDEAFKEGRNTNIKSTYFTMTCHKKGTLHLKFNDEGILRRFNIAACRGKNWLPHEYGNKPYHEMDAEEKAVVESFEGVVEYNSNVGLPLYPSHNLLQLAA